MKFKSMTLFCSLCLSVSAIAANTVTRKTTEVRNEVSEEATELSHDHSTHKTTADSQLKGTDADVAVTRRIRDRLTDMDSLSTSAQNITIVTHGNNVTLKGGVAKQEEILKIMEVARETASGKTITNELSVQQ